MKTQQIASVASEELAGPDAEMVRRLASMRQCPSPALVARVRRIATLPQARSRPVRRWAWGLAGLVALLAILLVAVPPLRAAIADLVVTIGKIQLKPVDRLPGSGEPTVIAPQQMSLEEARSAVPFAFGVPQLPEGWVMKGPVRVNDLGGGPFVEITWSNPGRASTLVFDAFCAPSGGLQFNYLVGTDSFREVQIGGQPAVVTRGGWDQPSNEWSHPEATTVIWKVGDVEYRLMTTSPNVSEEELLAIAESTR